MPSAHKRHILVDEYQDMNRASGVLLKELVQPGQGPWVVVDLRQAIYRVRGASPLNLSRVSDDFPGARSTELSIKYRSGGRIVRAFETFGGQMATAALVSQDKLQAQRGEHAGEVLYEIASTREAEANGIAKAIRDRVAAGDFDSAITRSWRARILILKRGWPASLSGPACPACICWRLFRASRRSGICSALISVVAEPRGIGLLRVAQMPQYAVPPDDIAIAFAWRRAQRVTMLAAVRRFAEIDGLSDVGREGLRRLSEAIRDVGMANVAASDFSCPTCSGSFCPPFAEACRRRKRSWPAASAGGLPGIAICVFVPAAAGGSRSQACIFGARAPARNPR